MAVIERQEKIEQSVLRVKIPTTLKDLLDDYGEFKNRTPDEIIALSLAHVIGKDAEFATMRRDGDHVSIKRAPRKRQAAA